jgi:uncharacterized membrane protein
MSINSSRSNFAIVATFLVLTAVTTVLIRIPIPATTGYFNLGDIFIIASGLLFGPIAGLLSGAIGAGAADLYGYPQFVLATVVTKGLEGFLVGLLAKGGILKAPRAWFAALVGASVMVTGYFIFEGYIYPWLAISMPFFGVTNLQDAIVEIFPNVIQGVIGAVGGIGLWRALAGLRSGH